MIVKRMIFKEAAVKILATFVVLSLVFVVVSLVSVMGKAASGKIAVTQILEVLSYSFVAAMDKLVPLAFLVGVIAMVRRLSVERELIAVSSAGVYARSLTSPIIFLGFVLAIIVLGFSHILAPEAQRMRNHAMDVSAEHLLTSSLPTGAFQNNKGTTYFIDRQDERTKRYFDIIVHDRSHGMEGIVRAKQGYETYDSETGDRFLVLENGARYETTPGSASFRRVEFTRYALRIVEKKQKASTVLPLNAWRIDKLLEDTSRPKLIEFYWRFTPALSVMVFSIFLALVMSSRRVLTNPPGYLGTVLIYLIYTTLLSATVVLIRKGTASPMLGTFMLPILFAVLITIWFIVRYKVTAFFARIPMFARG